MLLSSRVYAFPMFVFGTNKNRNKNEKHILSEFWGPKSQLDIGQAMLSSEVLEENPPCIVQVLKAPEIPYHVILWLHFFLCLLFSN